MLLIESFCSVFMNTQRAKTIWQQARCLSAAQMLNSLVFTKTSFKISMKCKTENLYSYWRFRFMFRYYSTRNSRQEGFVYIWVVLYRKPEAHQYLREATAFCGCNAAAPSPVVLCRFPVLWGGTADASPPPGKIQFVQEHLTSGNLSSAAAYGMLALEIREFFVFTSMK